MTAAILTSLCILTKPIRDVQSGDGQSTAESALLSALRRNTSELQEHMSTSGELEEARELLEEVRGDAAWFCPDTDDPTWSFVQQCLLQLLCLARHLSRLLEDFHQHPASAPTPGTPEAAPLLPPDVLSVAQQKTLSAVLQFVVTLGLCPYLSAGVGVPLGRRSAFGGAVEGVVRRDAAPCVERRLFITTRVLLEVSVLASLATLIFTRHLGDIMAALCQLSHQPRGRLADSTQSLMPDQRKACREALHDLLNKVHQPIVIKELLVLQGSSAGGQMLPQAPPWLRRLCGQLLSDRLMQPHGVLAVVRAVLEGPGASGASDWRKCDAVAKILASCPQKSVSAESYYSHVCPQVLELLHFKDKLAAQQFQRVATRAALSILQQRPEFAQRFFMGPLLSPLQRCADHAGLSTMMANLAADWMKF